MSEVRTNLFSSFVPALSTTALPTGLFALGLAYAGVGATNVVAGSIAATALATLRNALTAKAAQDRLTTSASPAVAYLSRVVDLAPRP